MKKRLLSLVILPMLTILALFGCGSDKSAKDIQELYTKMTTSYVVEDKNILFADDNDTLSLYIYYPDVVKNAIKMSTPSNDVQKRYVALGYQQKILDFIFDYYSNNQENFYRVADSQNIDNDDLNDLYNKLSNLNSILENFMSEYNTFIDATKNGISDIMEFNITSYSFELNKVIDASFDFIFNFHDIYSSYCLTNYSTKFTAENLNVYVDKAYLDIAYVVYLENIKAFNFSVGKNGVCDLAGVIGNNSEYNLLELLDNRGSIKDTILNNLDSISSNYDATMEKLNDFAYSRNVYNQRLKNYKLIYNTLNMFEINGYKFYQVNGVTFDNYINSLSASERATVLMLDNFIEDIFYNYVEKLQTIVE